MRKNGHQVWRRAAMGGAAAGAIMAGLSLAPSAYAQEQTTRFDVPAQPLASALLAVGRQAKVSIAAPQELVRGKTAPAVQGEFTARAALSQLLTGSGLEARFIGADAVRIETRPQAEAAASSAAAEPTEVAEVTVTGSLLARSDVTSASPVSVISAQQVTESASMNITEILKQDPSIGVNSRGTTLTINGAGASNVNLRNLGSRRTLAMVDGRRLPLFSDAIGNASQDTSVVPTMMLQRIEVLRDGASTIYGADAVAGVVNFILRDTYDGLRFDARYGVSERGDGDAYRVAMMAGHTFDRGSVIVSASYEDQNPIPMNARGFTHPAIQTLAPLSGSTYGTASTPGGQVLGPGPATALPIACYPFSQGAIANSFDPRCPRYDTANESSLIGGSTLRGLGLVGHYDITDTIRFKATAFQTRRQSYTGFTGVASANVDTSALTGIYPSGFAIPASNSNNPYGVDVRLRWRPVAYGGQPTYATANLSYTSVGFEGKLFDRFKWDVSHTISISDSVSRTPNLINSVSLFNLLNPTACAATPTCASVGAVPNIANMLSGATPLSAGQAGYLLDDNVANTRFSSAQTIATISGSLFSLPAGEVRAAIGAEHRRETGKNNPDSVTQSGVLIGKFVFPTDGRFSTNEVYGELDVPLLADMPLAKELTLNLQGRYSDFSNFGGAKTYKIGLNYTPLDGVRFRGALGTSFRAPDVLELYGGGVGANSTLSDPCNAAGLRATNAAVNANCVKLGVPANFTQTTGGALPTRSGGNPALQPERGRTYTFGVVLQPSFAPGLSATIDYYSIRIRDAIGTGNTQINLNNCYADANLVARASDPLDICFSFADRLPSGALGRILNRSVNSAVQSTSGVDMNFSYRRAELGFVPGSLASELRLSYLRKFIQQGVDLAGTFLGGVDGSSAFPVWRGNLTTTYSVSNIDVQWQVDYVDSIRDQNYGTSVPLNNFMNYSGVPKYWLHSLLLRWRPRDDTRLSVGVENLFDKKPPFALVTTRNSIAALHDQIGRYYYMTIQKEF